MLTPREVIAMTPVAWDAVAGDDVADAVLAALEAAGYMVVRRRLIADRPDRPRR